MVKLKYIPTYVRVLEDLRALSTCRYRNVSCIVIKDNRIIAQGVNGTPHNHIECMEFHLLLQLLFFPNIPHLIGELVYDRVKVNNYPLLDYLKKYYTTLFFEKVLRKVRESGIAKIDITSRNKILEVIRSSSERTTFGEITIWDEIMKGIFKGGSPRKIKENLQNIVLSVMKDFTPLGRLNQNDREMAKYVADVIYYQYIQLRLLLGSGFFRAVQTALIDYLAVKLGLLNKKELKKLNQIYLKKVKGGYKGGTKGDEGRDSELLKEISKTIVNKVKKLTEFVVEGSFTKHFYFYRLFEKYLYDDGLELIYPTTIRYIFIDLIGEGVYKNIEKSIRGSEFREIIKQYLKVLWKAIDLYRDRFYLKVYETKGHESGKEKSTPNHITISRYRKNVIKRIEELSIKKRMGFERVYMLELLDRAEKIYTRRKDHAKSNTGDGINILRLVKKLILGKAWGLTFDVIKVMNYVHSNLEVHAEQNALVSLVRYAGGMAGRTSSPISIFVTTLPCIDCAKLLSNLNVSRIYYLEEYKQTDRPHIDPKVIDDFLQSCSISLHKLKKGDIIG